LLKLRVKPPGRQSAGVAIIPISLLFPGLVELDSRLQVQDYAASSVDVSPDGLTYSFHVRPGLTWSDGAPISANSFAYAINRSLDPCTASPVAYYLFAIKDAAAFNSETCVAASSDTIAGSIQTLLGDSLVVSDALTLKIRLAQPAAYFLAELSYPTSYAVPVQLIDHDGIQNDTHWTDHLAKNGGLGGSLYKLTQWDHAGRIVLQRNDAFWGAKPRLREIDVTVYEDGSAAYDDYNQHKLDVGYPTPTTYANASKQSDFHATTYLETDYFAMNWVDPPFNDVTMRQAFALALNKDQIAGAAQQGTMMPTNHIVPEGMPGYNASLTGVDGSTGLKGNPAKASQLEQAYVQAHCGGSAAACPKVVLTVGDGSSDLASEAQAASQAWQSAFPGYPISIQAIGSNALIAGMAAHKLQLWASSRAGRYPDPQDWLSAQFLPGAQYNYGNVKDAQASALLTQADADQNQAQRVQLDEKAEQLLVDDVAWLPVDQAKTAWQVRAYVANYDQDALGYCAVIDQWPDVYIAQH
jgi:oligopeptide transport system substrate-binding protein